MLFLSAQQFSYNDDEMSEAVTVFHPYLNRQLENLQELSTMISFLKAYVNIGLDERDTEKYLSKIETIEMEQQTRFNEIDELINTNVLQIKKGKSNDRSIFLYGKEVRKLEAGLRTLRLFCQDAVKMLKPNSDVMNRAEERIRYFETRAAVQEVENRMLLNKLEI